MNLVELLIYAAAWEVCFRQRWTPYADRPRALRAAADLIEACRE